MEAKNRADNLVDSFDPEHSELERNQEKLQNYVRLLEDAFGAQTQVVGILEIGSFAKGEGVPTSDIDTRVYVISPKRYLFNSPGPSEQSQSLCPDFIEKYGQLPREDYSWDEFNEPVAQEASEKVPGNIEFGFVDQRHAAFELDNLAQAPSAEHAFLLQSTILYDPQGFLARKRRELRGRIFAPLKRHYREQFLEGLSESLHRWLS